MDILRSLRGSNQGCLVGPCERCTRFRARCAAFLARDAQYGATRAWRATRHAMLPYVPPSPLQRGRGCRVWLEIGPGADAILTRMVMDASAHPMQPRILAIEGNAQSLRLAQRHLARQVRVRALFALSTDQAAIDAMRQDAAGGAGLSREMASPASLRLKLDASRLAF